MDLLKICKEDKLELLESTQVSSLTNDYLKELVKICILNNSKNCFMYFLKTYSFRVTFGTDILSDKNNNYIYIDHIDQIDSDILKTCFYLIKTKGEKTQSICNDITVIIKECTRRIFTNCNNKKVIGLIKYIQNELDTIEDIIQLLCNEEKNTLFNIGSIFTDLQPNILKYLIKHDNLEYILYFFKNYEGPFEIYFDFLWETIISYNKYTIFNECYDQLIPKDQKEFNTNWLTSLVEYCIKDYHNLEFLIFLDERFCTKSLIKYNKMPLIKLLFDTFINKYKVYMEKEFAYEKVIECLKFLVNKGCQIYEKDLIFYIEHCFIKNQFTLERYMIDILRQRMPNMKLSNSYLLICLQKNIQLFYYLIDNDLINYPYDVSLLKMMETILFVNETNSSFYKTVLETREFKEEFNKNKNWWLGYLIFADLYDSKYYKIRTFKEPLTIYKRDLIRHCEMIVPLPKDLVDLVVMFI